jgi:small-conductance mechanosensitive channel
MPHTVPLQTAAPAPSGLSFVGNPDMLDAIPGMFERLAVDLVRWVRTDSLALLAGLAVGLLLYGLLLFLRRHAIRRLEVAGRGTGLSWVVLKLAAQTRNYFLLLMIARAMFALFGGPGTWDSLLGILFTIAATVQAALWAQELLLALVERRARPETDPMGTLSSAYGVVRVLIMAVVWALAGIILLDNLGVNVTALVAGLGVGGIAIGLAAQGIFSDLFAALSILFDQPFRRGDTIQVGGGNGVVGTVEHIGMKTTRLRALSGEMVILSNANILSQQVNNFAQFNRRRVVMLLSVIYQTPVEMLDRIPAELRSIVENRPLCRFDRAHFIAFSASSLDFELVFLVEDPAMGTMMDERHAIGLAILSRFAELDIDFAYPSQMSFMAGPDGRIRDPQLIPPPRT